MTVEMTLPRDRVEAQLKKAIAQAANLIKNGNESLEVLRDGYESWNRRNEVLLESAFQVRGFLATGPRDDYVRFDGLKYPFLLPYEDSELTESDLRADIEVKKKRLQAILGRLDLYEATQPNRTSSDAEPSPRRVFVIHGRDENSRLKVVDVIRRASDAEPVVLMEQPNQGRTIIEKLEEHLGGSSGFAVVILTGDDMGALNGNEPQPRARQNVILELGFAMAALGRRNVTLLHEPNVEIPSDVQGVAYYPLSDDTWRLRLLGDMKSAGFEVDPGKL